MLFARADKDDANNNSHDDDDESRYFWPTGARSPGRSPLNWPRAAGELASELAG
jgi:hypothetical protein